MKNLSIKKVYGGDRSAWMCTYEIKGRRFWGIGKTIRDAINEAKKS